jgi:hypothetical protein
MQFNMGYLDVEEEMIQWLQPTEGDKAELMRHMSDIMPHPAEFGVSAITFNKLEMGSWTVHSATDTDIATYTMQLCFAIHHDTPLSLADARPIVDAVYENGANAASTCTQTDHECPRTFLYPYHIIHDLGDE